MLSSATLIRPREVAIMGALETTGSVTGKPKISDEERRKRREAIDYGVASVGLEGFTISAEAAAENERYIDGEITMDELIALGLARAKAIKQ